MAVAHAHLDGRPPLPPPVCGGRRGGGPAAAVPRMVVRSRRAGQVAAAIEAAWRADDSGDLDDARARRLEAAWHLRVALRDGERVTGDAGLDHALLADLLRRAGEFTAAAAAARRGFDRVGRDGVTALLGFQIRLAVGEDASRHDLGEALAIQA